MNSNKFEVFDDLQASCLDGFITDSELVSKTFELLGCGDEPFWQYLPLDIRGVLLDKISGFSENDEVVSFGRRSPDELKKQLLSLKKWVIENKIT